MLLGCNAVFVAEVELLSFFATKDAQTAAGGVRLELPSSLATPAAARERCPDDSLCRSGPVSTPAKHLKLNWLPYIYSLL